MKQQHLNAYLEIIQELLTCPSGEEWIRLKQHEDLVNSELLQVMEQIASKLLQEGNRQTAIFLHNWAAKLHHILVKETKPLEDDKSQAYLSLIQALLGCSEEDKEKLLAEHYALVGPGLVHKMKQVAQQLKQQGSDESASYLQNLAAELNQTWIEAHAFYPDLVKESSKVPLKIAETTGSQIEEISSAPAPTEASSQKQTPTPPTQTLVTSFQLEGQLPLADAIHEISQALHQLNQTLTNQPHSISTNPLWYMDVLERATVAQWLLTTEEVEQLIGVKPKCHGNEKIYQRGTWTFIKVGKLGAQTSWKVIKTRLSKPALDDDVQINHQKTDDRHAHAATLSQSLAKHPPLQRAIVNNRSSNTKQIDSLEIPEMDDIWV